MTVGHPANIPRENAMQSTSSTSHEDILHDLVTTEELLQLDLGTTPEYVYDELEKIVLVTGEPSVLDPEFYRSRLNDVRIHMSTVARLTAKVVRARAAAESRLNSRETRYQMQVDSRLESDAHVKSGLSADDRKARAANPLADLRLAIRFSKNEVSSLKGMEKVISVYQKNLTNTSKDINMQARLVELELEHLSRVVPGKNTTGIVGTTKQPSLFARSVQEVEDQYNMSPEKAGEVDASGPLSLPEDTEVDSLRSAFASANSEFRASSPSASTETNSLLSSLGISIPDEDISTPEMSPEIQETPSSEWVTPSSTTHEELSLEIPGEEAPSLEEPPAETSSEEMSLPTDESFDFGDTSMSFEEESTSEVPSEEKLPLQASVFPSSDEEGVSDEDDEPLFYSGITSTENDTDYTESMVSEQDPFLPSLAMDAGNFETTPINIPMQEAVALAEVAAPAELPGDMFSMVDSVEIAPDISSVFTEDIARVKAAPSVEKAQQETPAINIINPITPEPVKQAPVKTDVSDMDSLLSELGLN